MKILHIGKFYPFIGGIEKVMYDLCSGMSRQFNAQCDILCSSSRLFHKQPDIIINSKFKILISSSIAKISSTVISPMMIFRLLMNRKAYDIIHIHHPDPMATLALFLSFYKGVVILHWHSDIVKQKKMLYLYKPLQSWMINRANKIVGTSPNYLESSIFLQHVQSKCTCLPIGVDRINYNIDDVNEIRSKFKGKKIIFSLGRLVEYKGYKYLIDSAKYLSDQYVILIGGSGTLMDELETQIVQNCLKNKVYMLGYLSDKEANNYLGACDVFCLSSIWKSEAFGIVQIEAMSCGKPIVATSIKGSGVAWVNENHVSGINVEIENPQALADAFSLLCTDDMMYHKYSIAAFNRFNKMFDKAGMVNTCNKIYEGLLSPEEK